VAITRRNVERKVTRMSDVDRSHLPIRRPVFSGVINRTLAGSVPDWNLIGHPTPPDGAPNVLLVLIDDAGFGNSSTFGGPIHTPNYTRIADTGLSYNRFHVTALCSPTRAALLTGRNNHAVGFGSVGEFAGGFPGYSATLPRDCELAQHGVCCGWRRDVELPTHR
jgi:arylsulfatase